ncbi:hypothetical protein GCM10010250_31260 [Streptomyces althioticus]|nr:hypothetical protein GCM10010250_31260 [Streptomyces althioticus]GGT41470.1 hypothetical protein GCM10010243_18330 [Streptomyces matensis]
MHGGPFGHGIHAQGVEALLHQQLPYGLQYLRPNPRAASARPTHHGRRPAYCACCAPCRHDTILMQLLSQ